MAQIINLPTFADPRGNLTVLEKLLPFSIKRLFWIYGVKGQRGGHRHIVTHQALIAMTGSVKVYCNNGQKEETFLLGSPGKCLLLPPEDWHTMDDFSDDCTLLVLASHEYDRKDYIDERY